MVTFGPGNSKKMAQKGLAYSWRFCLGSLKGDERAEQVGIPKTIAESDSNVCFAAFTS